MSSTKPLFTLPFLTLALALIHCSAPDGGDAANASPTASQDLVSAKDAFCKDFQGETPRTFCHAEASAPGKGELVQCLPSGQRGDGHDQGPRAGAVLPCDTGCSNAGGAHCLSAADAEDESFCRGKTGDIFPVTFCKPGGTLGKVNRLIQCIPGSQRGAFGDPGDSTSSITCINGCTNAGDPHCLSEAEVAETKFCFGKTGNLYPTLHCMKTPGAKDKLVECHPGSLRGEPTDPADSATSVECLSGCTETAGVASCNGTPQ